MDDTTLSKPIFLPIAIAVTILGLFLTVQTVRDYRQDLKQRNDGGYLKAQTQAEKVVTDLNAEIQNEMLLVQEVSDKLSLGELQYSGAAAHMSKLLKANPQIFGLGVGFAPYAYYKDVSLLAPYFMLDERGKVVAKPILYNYTNPSESSARWYVQAIEQGKGVWLDPYYGKASEDFVFTYSTPFTVPGDDVNYAGVVILTQSVGNTFKRLTQNADLGLGGYLFLVNSQNEITFHPESGLISKDVGEVSKRIQGVQLDDVLASVQNYENKQLKGTIELQDDERKKTTNETESWFFVRELDNPPGWKAVVVVSTQDLTYDPRLIIRQHANVYLAALVFLIGLGMWVIRVDRMTSARLMTFSVLVGFLFLGGILFMWSIIYRFPELNHQKVLVNDADIERELTGMQEAFNEVSAPSPEKIPTGILIENLTMTNQSVKISGYLWQNYPLDYPEDNIDFPQFTDQVGGMAKEGIYRYVHQNQRVVGWFFSAEIQQQFDNKLYPLDQAIIKIQIEPSTMSSEYVLVPAILDYDYMNPGAKPGLDRELNVKGWMIRNSFFTYDESDYGSNLGLFRKVQKDAIPNLVFNVRMNRNILSPIIAYCIVIYIVVMQVYGLSILKIDNPYQVMSISAALFLVVAITHTGMRDAVVITGVVYLEYYFILLYLTILATTINAFMNAANVPVFLLTYRDNLLIKILFWPVFLGIGLAFTLLTFYPFPWLT